MHSRNPIQVFEYDSLTIGTTRGKAEFNKKHFDALVKLNELHNNKYFTVGHKKIIFKQYVGVLQVADVCIEVLPKADRSSGNKDAWQKALIEMLKVTKTLKVNQVDHANVTKQSKHLLDIYFEWYLKEVQKLLYQGLIKKYYRRQGNLNTLKGKLVFAKQVSQNLVHKERFYTEHQVYDTNHLIHQILNQALSIIEQFTRGGYLYGKCKAIQLDFPEVRNIHATAATFDKLVLGRKEQPYITALKIARFIILQYSPNVKSGSEKMIALLFDMNNLWEEYILVQLKRAFKEEQYRVLGQRKKVLWNGITIRPDIVIMNGDKTELIIDTKWKVIEHNKPSTHDLRQMYVYNEYWQSASALLLYPANTASTINLSGFEKIGDNDNHQCGIATVSVLNSDDSLNKQLGEDFKKELDNQIFSTS